MFAGPSDALDEVLEDESNSFGYYTQQATQKQRDKPSVPSFLFEKSAPTSHRFSSYPSPPSPQTTNSTSPQHETNQSVSLNSSRNTIVRIIGFPPDQTRIALEYFSRFGQIIRWRKLSRSCMIVQFSHHTEAIKASREDPVTFEGKYMCGAQLVDPEIEHLFKESSSSENTPFRNVSSNTRPDGRLSMLRRQRGAALSRHQGENQAKGKQVSGGIWFYDPESWWNVLSLWMFGDEGIQMDTTKSSDQ